MGNLSVGLFNLLMCLLLKSVWKDSYGSEILFYLNLIIGIVNLTIFFINLE